MVFAASLGGFVSIATGWAFALIFAAGLMIFSFYFSEKIILAILQARYLSGNFKLINQIRNLSTHLQVGDVKVYTSKKVDSNIYVVKSPWGQGAIVVGDRLLDQLNKNEINSLVLLGLMRMRIHTVTKKTMSSAIFCILAFPLYVLGQLVPSKVLKLYISTLNIPFYVFKKIIFERIAKKDIAVANTPELFGFGPDWKAAEGKLRSWEPNDLTAFEKVVCSGLELVEGRDETITGFMF